MGMYECLNLFNKNGEFELKKVLEDEQDVG
jgi:hypothetical protein